MTEEEKIFKGELFCPGAPELRAMKLRSHNLCAKYNRTFEDETEYRAELLHDILSHFHRGRRKADCGEIGRVSCIQLIIGGNPDKTPVNHGTMHDKFPERDEVVLQRPSVDIFGRRQHRNLAVAEHIKLPVCPLPNNAVRYRFCAGARRVEQIQI